MSDKHLAVSLEHQAEQSRAIKKLEAENSRLRSTLNAIRQTMESIRATVMFSSHPHCLDVYVMADKALGGEANG